MSKQYHIQVPCKVNLFLRILNKRADGYHEIESLFVPVFSPCDEMYIQESSQKGLIVRCDTEGIDPQDNTLMKAFKLYEKKSGQSFSLELELIKGIKHGAGLGGGSADAGYFLRFLNKLSSKKLSEKELNEIALLVGADVVFFLQDKVALVSGIGEKITRSNLEHFGLNGLILLIISPNIKVNTKNAYKKFDLFREKILTEVQQVGKKQFLQPYFENSFEKTIFAEYPILAQYKEKLIQFGASFAVLSGSGSSLVGMFRSEELAILAKNKFQNENVYINYL